MRGRRNPRNRSSSPSTVLKRNITRMRPYQPQAPSRNALPASDSTSVAKSRFSGAATTATSSCAAAKATISGITTSHTRPPTRPLRGLRGERSQSASRTVDQRRVPCSRPTRIGDEDELPDEADREGHDQRLRHRHVAVAGEPVGEHGRDEPGEQPPSGAPRPPRRRRSARFAYCGISHSRRRRRRVRESPGEQLRRSLTSSFVGLTTCLDARRPRRLAPRRKAGFDLRLADDSVSYSGRRRSGRACSTFNS